MKHLHTHTLTQFLSVDVSQGDTNKSPNYWGKNLPIVSHNWKHNFKPEDSLALILLRTSNLCWWSVLYEFITLTIWKKIKNFAKDHVKVVKREGFN